MHTPPELIAYAQGDPRPPTCADAARAPGAGQETDAEAFYCDVLSFAVLPKPEPLASRGGRWFVCGDVQVHLGVEDGFRAARKAHPALRIDGFDATW